MRNDSMRTNNSAIANYNTTFYIATSSNPNIISNYHFICFIPTIF